jgi:hypothetical protein
MLPAVNSGPQCGGARIRKGNPKRQARGQDRRDASGCERSGIRDAWIRLVALSSAPLEPEGTSAVIDYVAQLTKGKIVLWCYLIWYCVVVFFYFDPTPRIWINSFGISLVIGIALMLSVATPPRTNAGRWQTIRLFLMPFCVSSFSSLIKGHSFMLVIPPKPNEAIAAVIACTAFIGMVSVVRWTRRATGGRLHSSVMEE